METKLEVAIIQANTPIGKDGGFYWLFSRNQLEFILKEVTVFQSPALTAAAQYRETVLPVVSLEEYFGLPPQTAPRSLKYLVLRGVTDEKQVVKVIVATPHGLRLDRLEPGTTATCQVDLPKHTDELLGSYRLSGGGVALVPDIATISRSLQWRGGVDA